MLLLYLPTSSDRPTKHRVKSAGTRSLNSVISDILQFEIADFSRSYSVVSTHEQTTYTLCSLGMCDNQ